MWIQVAINLLQHSIPGLKLFIAGKNKIDLTERQALSVDETGIHMITLKGICEVGTAHTGEKQWQIDIYRPDVPVQLLMHVTADGVFLRMEQTGRIHKRAFMKSK